jgi:hypothetical protein
MDKPTNILERLWMMNVLTIFFIPTKQENIKLDSIIKSLIQYMDY